MQSHQEEILRLLAAEQENLRSLAIKLEQNRASLATIQSVLEARKIVEHASDQHYVLANPELSERVFSQMEMMHREISKTCDRMIHLTEQRVEVDCSISTEKSGPSRPAYD